MTTKTTTNPYTDSQRRWNEQIGIHVAAARNWRWMGFLALLLAAVAVAGVIWFAGQPRLIPYIVEVNGKGEPIGVYAAGPMKNKTAEQNVLRFQLGQFISDVRSVTPDTTVQRKNITRAYAFLASGHAAHQQVGSWFRENSPFERSQTEIIAVEIDQILPVSEQTWRIEWTERSYTRGGDLKATTAMTASLMILQGGEVNEKNLLLNPTGLYIQSVDWQRELGQ